MKLTLGQVADWIHAEGDFTTKTVVMGYSIDSRTVAPEIIQPPDTIESTAMPRRVSSLKTNFAGGCWRWKVQMGHCSS